MQKVHVPKDEKTAIGWYQKAAAGGDALAISKVADAYEFGKHGLVQDEAKAVSLYHSLIADLEQSVPCEHIQLKRNAATNLANRYQEGRGVPKDLARAIRLLCLVANSSSMTLKDKIGNHYFDGHAPFPQDYEEAFKWYRIAVETNIKAPSTTLLNSKLVTLYDNLSKYPDLQDRIIFNTGAAFASLKSKHGFIISIRDSLNNLARDKPSVFDEFLREEPAHKVPVILADLVPDLQRDVRLRFADRKYRLRSHLTQHADPSQPRLNGDCATLIIAYAEAAYTAISFETKDCFEAYAHKLKHQFKLCEPSCPLREKANFRFVLKRIDEIMVSLSSGVHNDPEYHKGIKSLELCIKECIPIIPAVAATGGASSSKMFNEATVSGLAKAYQAAIKALPLVAQELIQSISSTVTIVEPSAPAASASAAAASSTAGSCTIM